MFYAKIRFNKEVRGHEAAPILAVGREPDLKTVHPGVVRQGEGTWSSSGPRCPMKRARQPYEVAPSYVFLASEQESSYMTEQFLHVNGGVMVNW